mmetsp:Transcript_34747/g.91842  ORF Transcript_34747/g.91842 Transcript_34747/m.91842 type:complete len:379 (+) Transcript_34747:58-1194(+)
MRPLDSMLGARTRLFSALLAFWILPWAPRRALGEGEALPGDGRQARAEGEEDAEECAVLQLRTSLATEETSQELQFPRGNFSPLGIAPVAARAAPPAALLSFPLNETQEMLLSSVAQRSAAALLDSRRVWAHHSRVRAELDRVRAENGRMKREAARLREESAQLEIQLASQQAAASRGPLAATIACMHQYWLLILAVSVGLLFFALCGWILVRWCTKKKKKRKRDIQIPGQGDLASPEEDADKAKAPEGEEEKSLNSRPQDDDDDSCLGMIYTCFCGCSTETKITFYSVCLLWNIGLAGLWHFGILQPLLRQLVIFAMLGIALVAFVGLMAFEAWMQTKGRFGMVVFMLDFIHRKIDSILNSLGFDQETLMERSRSMK